MAPRLSAVVGRLTLVNILMLATGFISGPLLARALGAHGRGDLAAILVPLSMAPFLLSIALPNFANREVARGRPFNVVFGSLALPLLAIGLLALLLAWPLASLLAQGRDTVRVALVVVFALTPISLVTNLLISCAQGEERWRDVIVSRLIAFLFPFVATVVLFVAGELTVATAAASSIAAVLLAAIPLLSPLFTRGRLAFERGVMRAGLAYGVKAWGGGLAYLANARVDQVVMITAVSSRELGLYAVAVTLSGPSAMMTNALGPPLLSRVAAGHIGLLPQALRITLLLTAAMNVVLAAVTPVILELLFGHEFLDAIPMTLILLAAALPLAGASVLTSGLQADGAPAAPSVAELLALVITFAGLLVVLGPLGGVGAALVSLGAYSVSFLYQLVVARRRWAWPLRAYLMPTQEDVVWGRELLGRVKIALRARRAPASAE